MPGYFSISLALASRLANDHAVNVTVTSEKHYSGNVTMTYSYDGTAPLYISPTSNVLFVPKNGGVTDSVTVGLNAGQSTTLTAGGTDGVISDFASIPVSDP
jgi:hypothetical protein